MGDLKFSKMDSLAQASGKLQRFQNSDSFSLKPVTHHFVSEPSDLVKPFETIEHSAITSEIRPAAADSELDPELTDAPHAVDIERMLKQHISENRTGSLSVRTSVSKDEQSVAEILSEARTCLGSPFAVSSHSQPEVKDHSDELVNSRQILKQIDNQYPGDSMTQLAHACDAVSRGVYVLPERDLLQYNAYCEDEDTGYTSTSAALPSLEEYWDKNLSSYRQSYNLHQQEPQQQPRQYNTNYISQQLSDFDLPEPEINPSSKLMTIKGLKTEEDFLNTSGYLYSDDLDNEQALYIAALEKELGISPDLADQECLYDYGYYSSYQDTSSQPPCSILDFSSDVVETPRRHRV